MFIACDFGVRGICILGEIDSSASFHALTWRMDNMSYQVDSEGWAPYDTSDERIMKKASSLRIQLSGRIWYDLDKERYYIPRVDQAPPDSLIPSNNNFINDYTVGADAPTWFFMRLPSEWVPLKKFIASSEVFRVDIPRDRISEMEKRWKRDNDATLMGDSHKTVIQHRYGPFRFERMDEGSAMYILEYNCEPANEDYTYGVYGWDLIFVNGGNPEYVTLFQEHWGS
ncbi:MAG: hypothetical protein ACLFQB_16130 [Chitinispirillaceae bacterium]